MRDHATPAAEVTATPQPELSSDEALLTFLTQPKDSYTIAEVALLMQSEDVSGLAKAIRYLAGRGELVGHPKRAPREVAYDSVVKLLLDDGRAFTDRVAAIVASQPNARFALPGTVLTKWLRFLIGLHEQSHCDHEIVDGTNANTYCRHCLLDTTSPHPAGVTHAYVDADDWGYGNLDPAPKRRICISCLHATAPRPRIARRDEAKILSEIEQHLGYAMRLAHDSIRDAVRWRISSNARRRLLQPRID